ncbi:hypothetical protein SAMN05216221_1318 [Pseudomonas oryzae]|uniref:Signal recognition particle receptor subunit beta, a GTPase n=1 Tax=Pseudomonas oryzae TaxID=1392877 RepID=A0A1H1QFV5_9PSED|nr:hypothetical protein SAMN05216221_1318 [Pseudomonas oryzae]
MFAGPFGVGKTTALRSVSDIPVVNTDVASTKMLADVPSKHTTTVGFDYGEWHFPEGKRVSLIGIPGQNRFEAIWDLFLSRSSAVVLWVFGERSTGLSECRDWLEILACRGAISNLSIAVTRVNPEHTEPVLESFRELIAKYNNFAPVMIADPRKPTDVIQTITMALSSPATKTGPL